MGDWRMKRAEDENAVKLSKAQSELLASYYEQFYSRLYHYANSSLQDPALAEELVQETFRRACERMEAFLSSPNPGGWLYVTLKNVINETRRERERIAKMLRTFSATKAGEEIISFDGDRAMVNLHYGGILKPEDFALLCRVAIDNYTMMEAAEEFGLTLEGCKKRVQRKSRQLADELEKTK